MTVAKDSDGFRLTFDDDLPEDERRFYLKVYPSVNVVSERKVHCTVCGVHIGTAPSNESVIRMHPILKVTHCKKCHEFYNSGEFSKGEDGSELYCRWCGQGGEVYCCSKCPYVFCTNCIVQNLSKDCVNDIEENENWNCFVCAPKIMWHLRAQHWALMNFIEKQKQDILDKNLSEASIRKLMTKDKATCCKPKSGNISDSSCDSEVSLSRKRKSMTPVEKKISNIRAILPKVNDDASPEAKKSKPNDEVVCTPDVLSLIEQTPTATAIQVTPPSQLKNGTKDSSPLERQRPTPPSSRQQLPVAIAQNHTQGKQNDCLSSGLITVNTISQQTSVQSGQPQANVTSVVVGNPTPPLAIRTLNNTNTQARGGAPGLVARKSVIGNRTINAAPGQSPVYHTINGFRIDLNTAAQQETFRLPNGKLIQVKRQGTTAQSVNLPSNNLNATPTTVAVSMPQQIAVSRAPPQLAQIQPQNRVIQSNANIICTQAPQHPAPVQQFTIQQPSLATIRYAPATGQIFGANGSVVQTQPQPNVLNHVLNGSNPLTALSIRPAMTQPILVKHIFPSTPLGQARGQLQNQIFASMDICQHLIGKVQTLTNSNAYKTARNYTDVKELYIHLSYLFTYAIGRFKTIQEKCMDDMRCLGFAGDAATLESGQLEKYASDNDEDDIVIVEPKTTLIDLDSDDEENSQSSRTSKKSPAPPKASPTPPATSKPLPHQSQLQNQLHGTLQVAVPNSQPPPLLVKPTATVIPPIANIPAIIRPVEMSHAQMQQQHFQQHSMIQPQQHMLIQQQSPMHSQQQAQIHSQQTPPPTLHHQPPQIHHQMHHSPQLLHQQQAHHMLPQGQSTNSGENVGRTIPSPTPSLAPMDSMECDLDFTANLLAGMLDVELHEGTETVQITAPPKKPRKKTTNKPNPHLIKQQQIQAREREREFIKHDAKLNKKCIISIERIDETSADIKKKLQDYIAANVVDQLTNDDANLTNSIASSIPAQVDNSSNNDSNKKEATADKSNGEQDPGSVALKDASSCDNDADTTISQEDAIIEPKVGANEDKSESIAKSDKDDESKSSSQDKTAAAKPPSTDSSSKKTDDLNEDARNGNEESNKEDANDIDLEHKSDTATDSDKSQSDPTAANKAQGSKLKSYPAKKPTVDPEKSESNPDDIMKQLSELVNTDKDEEDEQIELLEVIDQPDEEMFDLLTVDDSAEKNDSEKEDERSRK